MTFKDKNVVVTGAAGVFGRWIAAAFAREGARLCLSDRRLDAVEALAGELGLDQANAVMHATELTDEASIVNLAETVRDAWGAPDVVINNAGIYPKGGLVNLPTEDWDRMFVNLRAPFLVTRKKWQS